MFEIKIIENPQFNEMTSNVVSNMLSLDSRNSGFEYEPQPISLSLMNNDELIGGLTGKSIWDWMYVETLAVETRFRGQGWGAELIRKVESVARKRNCRGVWVDTYTFQSPDFYLRLGYQEFGRLPDNPAGHARIFLQKILN